MVALLIGLLLDDRTFHAVGGGTVQLRRLASEGFEIVQVLLQRALMLLSAAIGDVVEQRVVLLGRQLAREVLRCLTSDGGHSTIGGGSGDQAQPRPALATESPFGLWRVAIGAGHALRSLVSILKLHGGVPVASGRLRLESRLQDSARVQLLRHLLLCARRDDTSGVFRLVGATGLTGLAALVASHLVVLRE